MALCITRTLYAATRGPDLNAVWMAAVGVRDGIVAHETRRGDGGRAPVRCLVARRRIARGERICAVPGRMLLTGSAADSHLRRLLRGASTNGAADSPLPRYEDATERLRAVPPAAPRLLASRDALLLTSLLYLHRSPRYGALAPPTPLTAWVRTMPRHAPPLGLFLMEHLARRGEHQPLQRRLRLGDRTTPLLPGTDAAEAATDLVVAAVEERGLAEGLRSPRTEVVLTQTMLTDFYEGRHTALTPRQFEAAAAHTLRHSESAAVRRLAALEAELDAAVTQPLLAALVPEWGGSAAAPPPEEEMEAMRWAHFMVRSRALNLRYRRGPPQLVLVPLLDRVNHHHNAANITYSLREDGPRGEATVIVAASRAIAQGEELLLHYGSVGQRGCLFGDSAAVTPPPEGRQSKMDAVTREVRAIEAKQRREHTVDEDEDSVPLFRLSAEEAAAAPSSDLSTRGSPAAKTAAERDAATEATWLWRYGFLRPEAERAYEASHRWSRGLRDRLAHLTDVRRKGAPGAFVVGVPEGLEYLREQRENLERERYGNTRVFPPQGQ